MACLVCGDPCRCHSSPLPAPSRWRPRFELDGEASLGKLSEPHLSIDQQSPSDVLRQFPARVEAAGATPRQARFVPDQPDPWEGGATRAKGEAQDSGGCQREFRETEEPACLVKRERGEADQSASRKAPSLTEQVSSGAQDREASSFSSQDLSAWKQEVAARVERYRRRRPQPPKYPSLRLKFPLQQRWTAENSASTLQTNSHGDDALEGEDIRGNPPVVSQRLTLPAAARLAPSPAEALLREAGRILEFPRTVLACQNSAYELAEPIMDRPRIIEVPEITPLPPALGGIMLEAEDEDAQKRPGLEIPLELPPFPRRLLACSIDGFIVLAGCALFAYIFLKMTVLVPPRAQLVGLGLAIPASFWIGFQYLFLVLTGSTPGLKVARMRVSYFDGSPVGRSMRRWRVLASVLSLVSLGLGLAWCFLDEDTLCWHDRITHTYLAPLD